MTSATEQDTITLNYSLYDLPTAQHKAGLAGLLFLLKNLKATGTGPLPEIIEQSPVTVSLKWTEQSLQTVFQALYAACLVERTSKDLFKDKKTKEAIQPLRVEERILPSGKKEKLYVYQDVRPQGKFLADYYPGGEASPWLKLWRDMIWEILRGRPTTRGIYQNQLEPRTCTEATNIWNQLQKSQKPKIKYLSHDFSSSIFIGAEKFNAELVPFKGLVANNLLLHFWTLTSLVYVAQTFTIDNDNVSSKNAGYILAIPEVSHLEDFLESYIPLIQNLPPDKLGYRPKTALVTLPDEAGMEFLYHLAHAGFIETKGKLLKRVIQAVELYHLEKKGKNTHILSTDKVIPQGRWFQKYEIMRNFLRNPFFKRTYLRNLLEDKPWYTGFSQVLSIYSAKLFIHSSSKATFNFFGLDVRNYFQLLIEDLEKKEKMGLNMPELKNEKITRRIYWLIGNYVKSKSEYKSGITYESFKDNRKSQGDPLKYREAREKVCSDAFLAMRGRRDADFIEYFTGTICSVPHYLPEEEFIQVGHALLNDWETVKTLSMLALSAHSYLANPKKETEGEDA